jgi:hypothetical protein
MGRMDLLNKRVPSGLPASASPIDARASASSLMRGDLLKLAMTFHEAGRSSLPPVAWTIGGSDADCEPPISILRPEWNKAALIPWDAGGMAPLADYETMGPEERLRRIGRLLCKAAVLALARREAGEVSKADDPPARSGEGNETAGYCPLNAEELELLRRARHLGGISPREASRLWKVSRATTYRRLSSLEGRGWIARHGATTATRFSLTRQAMDWFDKPTK